MLKKRPQGTGLATVLMVSALLVVVSFTIVGLGFNHLSVSHRLSNSLQAKNLADAAVSKAIALVLEDPDVGKTSYTGPKNVTVLVNFPNQDPTVANAVLTFSAANAGNLSIPASTNNFKATTGAAGSLGRQVPADGVHLVAVGSCNGVTRTVEAVLYLPKFPWSIASSGKIGTNGGLYVAAVKNEADVDDPTKHVEGHLVTNSNAGDDAVKLQGSNNKITGDLQSATGANTGTAAILGEKRLQAGAVELIDLDLDGPTYDTAGKPGLTNLNSDTGTDPVAGWTRFNGGGTRTLTFDRLDIDKGVLYVDGNLVVNGGIHGSGAIIVKGTTTIRGAGSMNGDANVALLSKGKVDIAGDSGNPQVLKGLLYSEGGLTSNEMKLRGLFVNNDPSGMSDTQMDNTEFIQTPMGGYSTQVGGAGSGIDGGAVTVGVCPTGSASLWNATAVNSIVSYANTTNPVSTRWTALPADEDVNSLYDGSTFHDIAVPVRVGINASLNPDVRFWDDANKEYTTPFKVEGNGSLICPEAPLADGVYKTVYDETAPKNRRYVLDNSGVPPVGPSDLVVCINGTEVPFVGGQYTYQGTPYSWQEAAARIAADKPAGLTAGQRDAIKNSYLTLINNSGLTSAYVGPTASLMMSQLNEERGGPTVKITFGPPPSGQSWAIDLSQMIGREELVRILYWREL